ncbi:MAG: hypothetical protein H7Z76_07475 [Methylotenera sp.]|nr:hypothetical protein [Flavobacterium sp.]
MANEKKLKNDLLQAETDKKIAQQIVKKKKKIERNALQVEIEKNLDEEMKDLELKGQKHASSINTKEKIRQRAKKLNISVKNLTFKVIEKQIKEIDQSYKTRDELVTEFTNRSENNDHINVQIQELEDLLEEDKMDQKEKEKEEKEEKEKEEKEKEEKYDSDNEVKTQDGQGRKSISDSGLDNFQIDKLMKKYPEYLGCISNDEIPSRIIPQIKPKSVGCFVINTDPASKLGQHWQAVYFDGKKDMEIDFYDSFADSADKNIMKGVKLIADKLEANTYLKFKENKVKQQDDRSANCGFFAVKFLIDRLNGKHFQHASGYNDVIRHEARKGEKEIGKFKRTVGYGPWKFIKSFANKVVDIGKEAVKRISTVITGRTSAPPIVRNLLERQGHKVIAGIKVGRRPVNKVILGVLNAVSEGTVEDNRKSMNYDDIFHLFLIVTLNDGYKFKIERNESVGVSNGNLDNGEQINVPLNKKITLNEFVENGSSGNSSFWQYHPVTNNCQLFCVSMLSQNGLLTSEIKAFILQDAERLMLNTPVARKFAEHVANLASKVHILIHGANRKR